METVPVSKPCHTRLPLTRVVSRRDIYCAYTLSTRGRVQIVLLHNAGGAFSAPPEPCPFRMTPMPDEDVDALDDNVATVLQQADCDTCSQILLPKQLHLDDGAEDLLLWFRDTVKQAGVGAVPASDAKCAPLAAPLLLCVVHMCTYLKDPPRCMQGAHGAAAGAVCGGAQGVALHVLCAAAAQLQPRPWAAATPLYWRRAAWRRRGQVGAA